MVFQGIRKYLSRRMRKKRTNKIYQNKYSRLIKIAIKLLLKMTVDLIKMNIFKENFQESIALYWQRLILTILFTIAAIFRCLCLNIDIQFLKWLIKYHSKFFLWKPNYFFYYNLLNDVTPLKYFYRARKMSVDISKAIIIISCFCKFMTNNSHQWLGLS